MDRIVIASGSFILEKILKEFDIPYSAFVVGELLNDGIADEEITPKDIIKMIAYKKAKDVSVEFPDSLAIASTTYVYLYGNLLNQPKSDTDAIQKILSLSGKHCQLITAIFAVNNITGKETYDLVEEHVRIKFFTDQEIRNISNNKYFDDAGKPLVFWLDESFKDDSSLKNKNSIKDKIKLSVSKILIKNGVISEKLNKFKKSDNYSFDQIPLSEKKDVFGTKNIYFEDKSSNIKEEENNVHKDTRELKEDEEKEDYIKIEKEQDIPLHKSFDYEHIDNKNKNKEYYKKLDNVNYGYLEPQHKKISDNEEDEEDMTDNVSGKSRLRIDTDNIFDKFKKNDDPYNIARKRKKLVSGNKNNRDHDSDRSSKDRSEKEESKNTKHHSKKRKNKNKDKSEHKENIRDGIIPVIFGMFGWIFGQDILVKFIIALIAGIIAFGLIFRSMGLMLGY